MFGMDSDELKKQLGVSDNGTYRIVAETGHIEKRSWAGWSDTGKRIDPESGNVQDHNWAGYTDSGTRIDRETGRAQERDALGYSNTNARIDLETGAIQERSIMGWENRHGKVGGYGSEKKKKEKPPKPPKAQRSSGSGGGSSGGGGSGIDGTGVLVFLIFVCAICSALKNEWDNWGKPPEFPDWEIPSEVADQARQELQKALNASSQPGRQVAVFGVCRDTVFKEKYQLLVREGLITWTIPGSPTMAARPGEIYVRDITDVKIGEDAYNFTQAGPKDQRYLKTAKVFCRPRGDKTENSFVFPNPRDRDIFIARVIALKRAIEAKHPQLFAVKVVAEPDKWSERVFVYGSAWDYDVKNPEGRLKLASEKQDTDVYEPGTTTNLRASAWVRFKSLETRSQEVIVSRLPRLTTAVPIAQIAKEELRDEAPPRKPPVAVKARSSDKRSEAPSKRNMPPRTRD